MTFWHIHLFLLNLFADFPSCSHVDWAICRFWTYLAGVPVLCPWLFISLPRNFPGATPQCWWSHLWITLFRHRAFDWRRGENKRGTSRSASSFSVFLLVHFIYLHHYVSLSFPTRWFLEFWTLLYELRIRTVFAFKVSQVYKLQITASNIMFLSFHSVKAPFIIWLLLFFFF